MQLVRGDCIFMSVHECMETGPGTSHSEGVSYRARDQSWYLSSAWLLAPQTAKSCCARKADPNSRIFDVHMLKNSGNIISTEVHIVSPKSLLINVFVFMFLAVIFLQCYLVIAKIHTILATMGFVRVQIQLESGARWILNFRVLTAVGPTCQCKRDLVP